MAEVEDIARIFPEAQITDASIQHGGVRCQTTASGIHLLNAMLRTASRVLLVLVDGVPFRTESDIRKIVNRAQIHTLWMDLEQSFLVDSSVKDCSGLSQMHLALVVKDGLCDAFRELSGGKRPDVDRTEPDVTVFAKAERCRLWLSLDLSGPGLHQRGYRRGADHEAPMRETLAAALLHQSGWSAFCRHIEQIARGGIQGPFEWQREGVSGRDELVASRRIPARMTASGYFLNPMCGTGTIGLEAALDLARIYPRRRAKDFAFADLKPFQALSSLWTKLQGDIESLQLSHEAIRNAYVHLGGAASVEQAECEKGAFSPIRLSDIEEGGLEFARRAAEKLGVSGLVSIGKEDFRNESSSQVGTMVILNPPYEKRVHSGEGDSYKWIGDVLKNGFAGSQAWIFSANLDAMKTVGLRATKSLRMFTGPLDALFCQYVLYPKSNI